MNNIKLETFKVFLETQEALKKEVLLILSELFKIKKFEDKIEVISIDATEEYQADCDGDSSHLTCNINLTLRTSESQLAFEEYLKQNKFSWRNLKIHEKNDIYGNKYSIQLKIYNIK